MRMSRQAWTYLCENMCSKCVNYDDVNGCSPDDCEFSVEAGIVAERYDALQEAEAEMLSDIVMTSEEREPIDYTR